MRTRLIGMALGLVWVAQAVPVPKALWGKWVVVRSLPTRTISCWDEKQARAMIGTELIYSASAFQWGTAVVTNPVAETRTINAEQFQDENSGRGANSSQVTFEQLGIRGRQVVQLEIQHDDADVTGATTEIPGDRALLKDRNTIIFSVCGVYFEAKKR